VQTRETGTADYAALRRRIDLGEDGRLIGSPQVVGDLLLAQSTDGALYAIDADSGSPQWRSEFVGDGFTYDEGSNGDGRIYLADPDGTLRALDLATGETIWEQVFDPANAYQLVTQPVIVDGILFIRDSNEDGDNTYTTRAFDAESGDPIWDVAKRAPLDYVVQVEDGVVVNAVVMGDLWLLDAKTGEQRGRVRTGGDQYSSVIVGDGAAFVGLPEGGVLAIDVATGVERWQIQLPHYGPEYATGMRTVADGKVYAYAGNRIYALDARDGTVLWDDASGDIEPVFSGGVIYAANPGVEAWQVEAIDAETGERLWTLDTPGQTHLTPAGDTLYAGVATSVYALDAATGRPRWRMRIGGSIYSEVAVAGGLLYAGGQDGGLYQIDQTGQTASLPEFDSSNAGTAEPLLTVHFDEPPSPAFFGIWRITIPPESEATLPVFAGPAAAHLDAGSLVVPDGIPVMLNAFGSDEATAVDQGQTVLLPLKSEVAITNEGTGAAELLVVGVVPADQLPEAARGSGVELELLAGSESQDALPNGATLGIDRWTLAPGAALVPTLSFMPEVYAVESGEIDLTTVGADVGATDVASAAVAGGEGTSLPGDNLRFVSASGAETTTVLILEIDTSFDLLGVPSGGGCWGRCLSGQ
jgi:outer membrane protein assembly factor BamB